MKKFYFILIITTILSMIIFIHPLTNYFESKYKYSINSDIKSKELYSVSRNFVSYLKKMQGKGEDDNSSSVTFKIADVFSSYKDKFFPSKSENTSENTSENKEDNLSLNKEANLSLSEENASLPELPKIAESIKGDKVEEKAPEKLPEKSKEKLPEKIEEKPVPVGEKLPNQKKEVKNKEILLIGDSLMHAIASSLVSDLNNLGYKVTNLSKSSTGLTNKEFYNWEEVLKEAYAKNSYQSVIAIFGANDAYSVFVKNKKLTFPSPEWSTFYKGRIDEILNLVKKNGSSLLWLETPCMRSPSFDNKIKILNSLFKEKMQANNFIFFKTRNKLCINDKFTKILSSAGNKIIRNDDGIHINRNGSNIISKEIINFMNLQNT